MSVGSVNIGAVRAPFLKDEVTGIEIPNDIALHILEQMDLTGANFSNLCRVSRTWYLLSNRSAILNKLIVAKFGNQKKCKNPRARLQCNIKKMSQDKVVEENLIKKRFSRTIFFHESMLKLATFKVSETGIKAKGTDGATYQWGWSEPGASCTVTKAKGRKQLAPAASCGDIWETKHNNIVIKLTSFSENEEFNRLSSVCLSTIITIIANGNETVIQELDAEHAGTPIFFEGRLIFICRPRFYGERLCVLDFNKKPKNKEPKDLSKDSKCSVQ